MVRKLMLCAVLLLLHPASWGQDANQALHEKLAAVRKSIAENQARLKSYQWVETTEVSLKGEVKKREQNECRYGADGQIQKDLIGAPGEPKKQPRGLKGKIVQKKVDELKDYMDRFGSLVRRYVPPDPQSMQAAFQAGKAVVAPPALVFTDYAKPGDKVTLELNEATEKLRQFSVSTYLDGPDDAVSILVRFSTLADGTNHVEEVILDSAKKQLQIKTTHFDYRKVVP